MKQRNLADLFVVGELCTIDDGKAGAVTVFVRKLNMTESELASRHANAARARILALRRDPESEAYLAAVADAWAVTDPDALVEELLRPEALNRRRVRTAELQAEDEWAKEDYLQGLYDAWKDGLSDDYAVDPTDPEAKRVFDELVRFEAEVTRRVEADLEDQRVQLRELDVERLQDRFAEELLKTAADMAWLAEHRRACVFYATRIPETMAPYFSKRQEVQSLQDETFDRLRKTLEQITIEPQEGKGSEGTPSSSGPSEVPDVEETEASSGLVAVGQ